MDSDDRPRAQLAVPIIIILRDNAKNEFHRRITFKQSSVSLPIPMSTLSSYGTDWYELFMNFRRLNETIIREHALYARINQSSIIICVCV